MPRKNPHLVLPALSLLALAACGGGGGSGSSSSSSGGPTPPTSNDVVTLTASGPAGPLPTNSNAEFEFVVSNAATTAASNVTLTVTLGTGLTRAGLSCRSTGTAVCPAADSMTVVSLPAASSLRYTVSVIVAANATGPVTVSGSVTASNDPQAIDNAASVTATAYTADVNVVGSTSASDFLGGATIPYSMTVTNAGPDAARDISLENVLGSGQTLTSITCVASGGATCPGTLGATMTVPTLPRDGALTFTVSANLVLDAVAAATNTLTATVRGDPTLANNAATASARTRLPTSLAMPSFVRMQSDVNDFVGAGRSYSYDHQNAVFTVDDLIGRIEMRISADDDWHMMFDVPLVQNQIATGALINVAAVPGQTFALHVTAASRGCSLASGWIIVDDATYVAGVLASLDLRFERHCEGRPPALRGQIHWVANDATIPPGPVNPPPAGLWSAPAGSVPTSGNYIYLDSQPGDFIGHGTRAVYTQANSLLSADGTNGLVAIGVRGDSDWIFEFKGMVPLVQLQPGYYAIADFPYPHHNPSRAGMSFSGDGHGCLYVQGWFVVDNVVYQNGQLVAFDARFQQLCDGNTGLSRGQIHWRSDDMTQPTPPGPPPSNLWAPSASAVPASGNFVYLEGESGDYISQGLIKLYTPLDSILTNGGGGMTPVGNRFSIAVDAEENWVGHFQAMSTLTRMEPGYYPDLLRFTSHNPARGGISWTGEGRGCNSSQGWFAIDSVTYAGDTLTAIDLRFEQRNCDFGTARLRGRVRWSAADTRQPPGPVPVPAGLWQPPGGSTPANINYAYLVSEPGEFIGQGQTYLYTSHNAIFPTEINGSLLDFEVHGDKRWRLQLQPMVPRLQLEPGYYDLTSGNNPAKGMMNFFGDFRGCGGESITGWVAIEFVEYTAGSLTALDLRFEQRCAIGGPQPMRGKIRWRIDDPTTIPGPQAAPAGLWSPPAGVDPGSGNFLYVAGDPGDYLTGGQTFRYVAADSTFDARTFVTDAFIVGAQRQNVAFSVQFDKMASIARLQPGYYPNVQRLLLHNPTVGGLEVFGNSRGCETVGGWFMIDSITYSGNDVSAIAARFEQHCNGNTAALRGSVRWSQ